MNCKKFVCILLLSILPGYLLNAQTDGQDAFVLISDFHAVDVSIDEMQEYTETLASLLQKVLVDHGCTGNNVQHAVCSG